MYFSSELRAKTEQYPLNLLPAFLGIKVIVNLIFISQGLNQGTRHLPTQPLGNSSQRPVPADQAVIEKFPYGS